MLKTNSNDGGIKMSFNKTGKIFMVLAIVAVLGIAVTSFAGWGRGSMGYGNHMGPGYGMHRGWSDGPRGYGGQGYQSDLSAEDIARLDKERQAFFEATSEFREELYQKHLEQRIKMRKDFPRSGYMGQGYGPRGMGRGMYGGGYGRGGGGCGY